MEEIKQEIIPPQSVIHERSLETLAPSGGSGDVKHDTNYSAKDISIYGAKEEERLQNISPAKRAAENLGGMFAPLEVKYQDLRAFDKIAKKNFSGNKYPTISPREQIPQDEIEDLHQMPITGLLHQGSAGSIHSIGS